MRRLRVACLIIAALPLAGCASEGEKLAPLGTEVVDAGTDAAPPPPPVPDAGTVKRTVMTRNPFGGPAGNHLIDGDFEFSTAAHAGQQLGWRAFTANGTAPVDLATETGGLCRSGLRCAVLASGTLHLLRGVVASGKGNVASGWARLPEGTPCGKVRPILINCDTFVVHKALVASKKPDAGGWCSYAVGISKQDSATCIYIDNSLTKGTSAVLDAFVLGPDDGTVTPLAAEFWVPDAETAARLENMKAYTVATMPFGKPKGRPMPAP